MIKAKTGITLLKRLGIVLIALPEPITTPFGVACVVASSYLSRLREASLNKHLHETLRRYLSHSKRSNDETDNKSHARQNAKHHTRIDDPTILWQNKSILPVETSHPPSVRQNQRDKEDNTVHHSVDTESLSRRYPVTVSPKAEPENAHSNVTPVETEKLIQHSIDVKSLSRRYPITATPKVKTASPHSDVAPEETEKLIHHGIDRQMLGRRYKASDSSRVASLPDKHGTAENVAHHTTHVSLSQRYAGNDSPDTTETIEHHRIKMTDAIETRSSDIEEKVEHHSINLKQLSQRYQTDEVDSVKSRYNTIP